MTEQTEDTTNEEATTTAAAAQQPKPRKKAAAKPEPRKPGKAKSEVEDDQAEDYVDLFNRADHRNWEASQQDGSDLDESKYEPVVIELAETDHIPGVGQPFVVNGRTFPMRAGVKYRIPAYVAMTIARIPRDIPETDENDRIVGYRNGKMYPFTKHGRG